MILDFLFPKTCQVCGQNVSSDGCCVTCWKNVRFCQKPWCEICGIPLVVPSARLCHSCLRHPPFFDVHRSLFYYGDEIARVIMGLKHGRDRSCVPWLAQLLYKHHRLLIEDGQCTVGIIPVPLHWSRLAFRCFNQSAVLAKAFIAHAKNPRLAYWPRALVRQRKTRSQAGLSPQERLSNVNGAFRVHPLWAGRIASSRILLLDDVFTTGATLNACAHVLKAHGAQSVSALTIAQTVPWENLNAYAFSPSLAQSTTPLFPAKHAV